ncbi:MAG: dihydrofolate reductase [Lachnospiraceae bacterium]|nr:dihydrofolate reductase [Lachnospiraceae bacterium]MBQ2116147.1 dihydrofolate reductase [Lachnospiraceae bacterium]MBQ2405364.1 dihydrofolate reductase [Lachnospiraceae bacterium]MEE0919254.1 dihydrofolate reductase [Lachnospiraceae bacterium]
MNMIVAVDNNWAIGYKNSLLVKIPRDQKLFQEMTTGKVVVMGRKTLESLPQKQPLQNRINIILSGNKAFKVKGATVVNSIEELLKELKKYNDNDIFIAGGESLYKQMLPYCDTAHVTKIDYEYQADTYCPDLDKMPEWEIVADSEEQTYFDLEYVFLKYKKKK